MITALIVIPLGIIVAVAVEMGSLAQERARLQAAVDAAALAGAREQAVAGSNARNAKGFAESFAAEQVTDLAPRISMAFTASQNANGSFQVSGVGVRASLFGNMIPPGGFTIRVSAIAEALNQQPLCVLALPENDDDGQQTGLSAIVNSSIQADNCLLHSNGSLLTSNNATVRAGTIQAARTVTGSGFVPAANSGALSIEDPFKTRSISRPNACSGTSPGDYLVNSIVWSLDPGVHNSNVVVSGTGRLTLRPGEYYFCKEFKVQGNGTLIGDNVVMIFDDNATLDLQGNSRISLTGRTTGDWAGFVIVASRENDNDINISSSLVDKLLGTIYAPEATLRINASGAVAEDSKWSVIVAKDIALDKNAKLVINSDYMGSGVPVPKGVGDNLANPNSGPRLKQ